MASIHDRMPVIVPGSAYDLWLETAVKDPQRLQALLVPFPAGEMDAYPVSTLVNNPKNDVEGCVKPVE
jgi:putative SOS response-associated peptidase YedK